MNFLNSARPQLIPGDQFLPGDQFIPGDQFLPGDQFIPGDQFAPLKPAEFVRLSQRR